jgi:hypothetical protein
MMTKIVKLGFFVPDETEGTRLVTNDITTESEMDSKTSNVKQEAKKAAGDPLAGMSED